MNILKWVLVVIIILLVLSLAYIYLNRDFLFNTSINRLIDKFLPEYLYIADVNVDFKSKNITVKNIKIQNPPGYTEEYLIEIPEANCNYNLKNEKNILEGVVLKEIRLLSPNLYIERSRDNIINVQQMDKVFKKKAKKITRSSLQSRLLAFFSYLLSPIKDVKNIVEFEPIFNVKNGRLIFNDIYVDKNGYRTTIENIEAKIKLALKKDLKGVDGVESQGEGFVSGGREQLVRWNTAYNPTAPRLTMSNTFYIREIDFVRFEPYYDRFSPFIFEEGRASGELIFNFDNGEIGSMNEVRFYNLKFSVKENYQLGGFWDVSVEDLYKYFASETGEVPFDFKIKGPMEKPRFYLGSKTKRALTTMTIDKISNAIFKKDETSTAPQQPSEEKSDLEKVIDIFKGLGKSEEE